MRLSVPPENRLNTGKGRAFQQAARELLAAYFGAKFEVDAPIAIGQPPKNHRFDLVSTDRKCVGECKNYSWTETGNVPSAKMGFVNEAVFYLSFLPSDTVRFVAMRKAIHAGRKETVADYYCRTYRHLLGGVRLVEIDLDAWTVREIGGSREDANDNHSLEA